METLSRSWVLRRNCAMTPRQSCLAFVVVGATSLAVSLAWALTGAWIVLPFMLIELLVLALAFLMYARHAADQERITLADDSVCVEVFKGDQRDRCDIPRQWLRCGMEDQQGLVRLVSNKKEVLIGQFVGQADRRRFYEEFRTALALPAL